MIELAKIQNMHVFKKTPHGFLTKSRYDMRQVILPFEQIIGEVELGQEVKVFIYKDSDNRLIGTMKAPKIVMGALKELEVVDKATSGAFMDWGLDKDLFLPVKEQKGNVRIGSKYLIGLYISNKDRICATMNIGKLLEDDSPFKENDQAYGLVYDIKKDMGAFVAVENKYHGLIPKHELFSELKVGDKVEVRITKVREDGKLNLSIRQKAYLQMDADTKILLDALNDKGIIPFNDKSDPERIKQAFGMSKKAFKRAVGRLLKEGKVEFTDSGIKLLDE
ncbi:CvfB family protein [Vallitalea okinawensis]|uniref:CvfB family protein n=1 Tax=Vallitalea okinawensis TaxID=2078660 RepID=UPI000CFBB978|nr:S1-like domain-containing RNA-binding protein [Vallitalea okinawensis]